MRRVERGQRSLPQRKKQGDAATRPYTDDVVQYIEMVCGAVMADVTSRLPGKPGLS